MATLNFAAGSGSGRPYVSGTQVTPESSVVTVADVVKEAERSTLLGDDQRRSDSHDPLRPETDASDD